MKMWLITGGAGFIGRSIVERLADRNNFVRVFDNEFRGSKKSLSNLKNIEFLKGDIRDYKSIEKATRNIDSVIHLAYINGTKYFYEKPELVLDVGVRGMINILDAAKSKNIKEFYLASSSEVYQTPNVIPTPETVPFSIPDPTNPRYSYGGGKIISELLTLHMASKFIKKVVIFRPHNVYGPNMGEEHVIPELITKIVNLKARASTNKINLPIQGDGKSTRSFIYIEDFTEAILTILQKGKNGQIYNVGTEDEISILKLIEMLEDVTNLNISIQISKQPEGGTNRRCPDTEKLRKLGFKPKTDLKEGLNKTFLWYNDNLRIHDKS